ncbi:hypothetical protein ACVBEF_19460 [Glaciimonas sp. GG7]
MALINISPVTSVTNYLYEAPQAKSTEKADQPQKPSNIAELHVEKLLLATYKEAATELLFVIDAGDNDATVSFLEDTGLEFAAEDAAGEIDDISDSSDADISDNQDSVDPDGKGGQGHGGGAEQDGETRQFNQIDVEAKTAKSVAHQRSSQQTSTSSRLYEHRKAVVFALQTKIAQADVLLNRDSTVSLERRGNVFLGDATETDYLILIKQLSAELADLIGVVMRDQALVLKERNVQINDQQVAIDALEARRTGNVDSADSVPVDVVELDKNKSNIGPQNFPADTKPEVLKQGRIHQVETATPPVEKSPLNNTPAPGVAHSSFGTYISPTKEVSQDVSKQGKADSDKLQAQIDSRIETLRNELSQLSIAQYVDIQRMQKMSSIYMKAMQIAGDMVLLGSVPSIASFGKLMVDTTSVDAPKSERSQFYQMDGMPLLAAPQRYDSNTPPIPVPKTIIQAPNPGTVVSADDADNELLALEFALFKARKDFEEFTSEASINTIKSDKATKELLTEKKLEEMDELLKAIDKVIKDESILSWFTLAFSAIVAVATFVGGALTCNPGLIVAGLCALSDVIDALATKCGYEGPSLSITHHITKLLVDAFVGLGMDKDAAQILAVVIIIVVQVALTVGGHFAATKISKMTNLFQGSKFQLYAARIETATTMVSGASTASTGGMKVKLAFDKRDNRETEMNQMRMRLKLAELQMLIQRGTEDLKKLMADSQFFSKVFMAILMGNRESIRHILGTPGQSATSVTA